jgi:hypothetical protein
VLELLVALPLSLLITGAAVQLFVTQLRVTSRIESRLRNTRELEHVGMVLAADLRGASASALESWTDSSIVLHASVLVGVVCATPAPNVVDIVSGDMHHALRAASSADPRVGDQLAFAPPDSSNVGASLTDLDSATQHTNIVGAAPESSACANSPLRGSAPESPWRITLAASSALAPDVGSFVTVRRRTEWRAYRAATNEYFLGRREHNGTAWSTTQPVAGPLTPTALGGFTLSVLRGDLTPASAAAGDARLVTAQVRITRRPADAAIPHDSITVQLALRGGR